LSSVLDGLAVGLLTAGVACVASGLLPADDAEATLRRIVPLLLFLGSVVILAELTAAAEVFDVVASRLAIAARGSYPRLFACCFALAALTTVTLNLDTTAVLLTPVMLALAVKLDVAPLPLAMTTVWLANTASLLLPVSNLTNLLAAERVGLGPVDFARRMGAVQLVVLAVTAALLWLVYWRPLGAGGNGAAGAEVRPTGGGYTVPGRHRPRDRPVFLAAAGACAVFVAGTVADVPLGLASALAMAVVVVAFWRRDRERLRPALLPWRLLVFVSGMFLVVQTIGVQGLDDVVADLVGAGDDGLGGAARAAAVGGGLSNALNNLPAYVAGEAAVPEPNRTQLLALLVGTNAAPVVTPWASLATLLWWERCRAHGVQVPLRRFVAAGAALAVVSLAVAIPVLHLTA
jgi:arsenical pump membrane protein